MDDLPNLPLSAQMRGEYLAEIKRLAKEHYLQLKIGTEDEFEEMWREAFTSKFAVLISTRPLPMD